MKLVKDWRKSWRWHSVQLAIVGALGSIVWALDPVIILQAWAMLPTEMQEVLAEWKKGIAIAVFVLAIIARLKDQGAKND